MNHLEKRKEIFIHIGQHKTGTTSIQIAFGAVQRSLLDYGVLYPKVGIPEWIKYGHHLLPWSLFEREEYLPLVHGKRASFDEVTRNKIWRDLRNEIDKSNVDRVVISSEEFDTLKKPEIDLIYKFLDGYDLIPIVFLRNHRDLIESSFRTVVVHSNYHKDAATFSERQRIRLDFHQMLRDWRAIAKDMIIVSYDDPSVAKRAPETFLDAIGLPSSVLRNDISNRRWNESLPAFVCEIIRFLRQKGCGEEYVQKWIGQMRMASFSADANRKYRCLPEATVTTLDQQYSREIKAIIGDRSLSPFIRGSLSVEPRPDASQVIKNIVDAILVLGRELTS